MQGMTDVAGAQIFQKTMAMDVSMTHYMELLMTGTPWNLLVFMAVPVILAELIAVTELYILYTNGYGGRVRAWNRRAGIAAGNREKMKVHIVLLAAFLVVAHVAMILGMMDPAVL